MKYKQVELFLLHERFLVVENFLREDLTLWLCLSYYDFKRRRQSVTPQKQY